jgi:hypothetical protein
MIALPRDLVSPPLMRNLVGVEALQEAGFLIIT